MDEYASGEHPSHVAGGIVQSTGEWLVEERVCRPSRVLVPTLDRGGRSNGAIRARAGYGWDSDVEPFANPPFGASYLWCAPLCGFSEAALVHGLLSGRQLDALRPDLEASLPGLRACRQLLVVIPASLEEQPRVLDLVRDDERLGRLRRVHYAFGEALREEQLARARFAGYMIDTFVQ